MINVFTPTLTLPLLGEGTGSFPLAVGESKARGQLGWGCNS